jgi:hypothetical protein
MYIYAAQRSVTRRGAAAENREHTVLGLEIPFRRVEVQPRCLRARRRKVALCRPVAAAKSGLERAEHCFREERGVLLLGHEAPRRGRHARCLRVGQFQQTKLALQAGGRGERAGGKGEERMGAIKRLSGRAR